MKPFKDPIAPKERKTSKAYVAPTKEGATTGRYIPTGDDYGTGFRTPVGSKKAKPISSGPIPFGSKCFNPDDLSFED